MRKVIAIGVWEIVLVPLMGSRSDWSRWSGRQLFYVVREFRVKGSFFEVCIRAQECIACERDKTEAVYG